MASRIDCVGWVTVSLRKSTRRVMDRGYRPTSTLSECPMTNHCNDFTDTPNVNRTARCRSRDRHAGESRLASRGRPEGPSALRHLARRRVGTDGRRCGLDRRCGERRAGRDRRGDRAQLLTPSLDDLGTLTATATPVRKGRNVHVWAIDLTDETGRMICIARCTLQVLKAPPAPGT